MRGLPGRAVLRRRGARPPDRTLCRRLLLPQRLRDARAARQRHRPPGGDPRRPVPRRGVLPARQRRPPAVPHRHVQRRPGPASRGQLHTVHRRVLLPRHGADRAVRVVPGRLLLPEWHGVPQHVGLPRKPRLDTSCGPTEQQWLGVEFRGIFVEFH